MSDDKRYRFLVVDSDGTWRKKLADSLSAFGGVCCVADAKTGLATIRQPSAWVGLVLDAVLADGCGFELLSEVRHNGITLPALVLTTHHDRDRINRAHTMQAEFLCKPPDDESIVSFARRAVAYHWTRSRRLATIVDAMAVEQQLTHRESELVAAALTDMPRRLVAEELGVSENTVKVQIRVLLLKFGTSSLEELADLAIRRALRGSGARPVAHSTDPDEKDERKIS